MVTVKELQAQLKKRGLETKGLKAELIKRLEEAENQENQATDEASAAGNRRSQCSRSDTKLQEPNAAAAEVVAEPIAQSDQETKTNQASAEEQKPAAEEQKNQTSADAQKSKSTDKGIRSSLRSSLIAALCVTRYQHPQHFEKTRRQQRCHYA